MQLTFSLRQLNTLKSEACGKRVREEVGRLVAVVVVGGLYETASYL